MSSINKIKSGMSGGKYELKHFGAKAVIYHMLLLKNINVEKYRTLYWCELEKKYATLDDKQLAMYLKHIYEKIVNNNLNYKSAETFTQKIQWMKIYDNTSIKSRLADKYEVREWITKKIGSHYLIPLLGVWDSFDEIDFNKLPKSFCLKTNHGSAMNYVVKDKSKMNKTEVRELFHWWMQRPFWVGSLETHYRIIPRKIIAEKYIEEMSGGLLDYKIHCFNGKPMFIQCIGERDLKKHTGYQMNFDLNWKPLNWSFETYPLFKTTVKKPKCLSEMLHIAEVLSADFKYVRVDLYEIGGKVFFGEMTFTPSSGFYPYKGSWNKEKDKELGSYIV